MDKAQRASVFLDLSNRTSLTWDDGSGSLQLTPSYDHPASFEAQVIMSVFIGILGVWSTLGNVLTLLAIYMHKNMQTKCNYFIFSLAISDLISGLIASPLWLYRRTWGFDEWMWGDFLCGLFWFVDESTSYCTAMHIASFAMWRHVGVKWPHSIEKIPRQAVKMWLSSIWIIALVFGGAIFCTFYSVEDRSHSNLTEDYARWPSCSIKTANGGVEKHLVYYTFSSSCFLLLPMAILFISSILIIRELLCHSEVKSPARKSKERKAVCQLSLIASSFLVGYVPMTAYVMWTTRRRHSDYGLDYWTHVAAYFGLRISECVNPIVYNIASVSMRRASKKVIRYIRNCCRSDAEIDFITHSPACQHRYLVRSPSPGGQGQIRLHSKHRTKSASKEGHRYSAPYFPKSPSNSMEYRFPMRTRVKQVASKPDIVVCTAKKTTLHHKRGKNGVVTSKGRDNDGTAV